MISSTLGPTLNRHCIPIVDCSLCPKIGERTEDVATLGSTDIKKDSGPTIYR